MENDISLMLRNKRTHYHFHNVFLTFSRTSSDISMPTIQFDNKPKSRYWIEQQPVLIHERPLYSLRVTVEWNLFRRNNQTFLKTPAVVNRDRYGEMINTFLFLQMDLSGLEDMWSRQDRATCHTVRDTMATLRQTFRGQLTKKTVILIGPQNRHSTPCL